MLLSSIIYCFQSVSNDILSSLWYVYDVTLEFVSRYLDFAH
jgi:hypothetical protein